MNKAASSTSAIPLTKLGSKTRKVEPEDSLDDFAEPSTTRSYSSQGAAVGSVVPVVSVVSVVEDAVDEKPPGYGYTLKE